MDRGRSQVEVKVALAARREHDLAAPERASADQLKQFGAVAVFGHLAAERLHIGSPQRI
jgi:hypothetical protein